MSDLTQDEKQIIIEALSNVSTNGVTWEQKIKPIVLKLQQPSKTTKEEKTDK